MPIGLGRKSKYQLDDDKSPSKQGVVSTRNVREKSKSRKQVDQDEGETGLRIPVECYSRIVGYLRPVQYWNIAKRQEFKDRMPYSLEEEKDEGKRSRTG